MAPKARSLLDPAIIRSAALAAFGKLSPLDLWRNPVMFATELVAAYVTILFVRDLATGAGEALFSGQIAAWLWITVWFATFAEAM